MTKIAVMVSGGGTNLQALIDAEKAGKIPHGKITLVIASNAKAYALERAAKAGIESTVVARKSYESQEAFDQAIVDTLRAHDIDLVILAGFLSILGETVIKAYPDRIINIHPSLIPSFCGKGPGKRRQSDRRHRAPGQRNPRRRPHSFTEGSRR